MLKLLESTEQLANISRELEQRIQLPEEFGQLALPVKLLASFEDLLSSKGSILPHDWAVYSTVNREILVNGSTFSQISEELAQATLAHEVGHAVFQCAQDTHYDLGYGDLHEELLADVLACNWGFCDEVCSLRTAYGDDYCSLLRAAEPTPDFVKRMWDWFQSHSFKRIVSEWRGA